MHTLVYKLVSNAHILILLIRSGIIPLFFTQTHMQVCNAQALF